MIHDAQQEGQRMLDAVEVAIAAHMREARRKLHAQMVDMAVERALDRLPGVLNENDKNRFVDEYVSYLTPDATAEKQPS